MLRWKHPQLGVIGPNEFIPIAEDVETKEQVDRLTTLGCNLLLGHYYGKTMKAENAKKWVVVL